MLTHNYVFLFHIGDDLPQIEDNEPEKGKDSDFIQAFKQLFLDELSSDVMFQVEGQNHPAHRWLLSARCKFFKNMFTSIPCICNLV